ncbi:BgTH12-05381 [Blumeria graminis f. sp. triticale]|uniref:BgTH12-05381 n=1 Tax=Blumeria graminis f. sp. triticale TaxID=1689686 RepID=A0A9W4GFF3_BLUGR|nr:BgTH12-05381 [Blumeria graminis f. sp. triticale]
MPIQHSTVTKLRSAAESENYDKTTVSLTEALKSELSGKMFRDVDKFWDVHFEEKTWSSLTKSIWESYRDNGQCGPKNEFTCDMSEKAIRSWLDAFRDRYLNQLLQITEITGNLQPAGERNCTGPLVRGKFCHIEEKDQFDGGLSVRQVDFFIESVEIPDCHVHKWRDVRAVGEVTSSEKKVAVKINQMIRYVREIFYAQPLRRFVHGFCLHEKHVEFWIIDRAGAYSSGQIDVMKDQEKLVRGLASYMLMSDEELGLDPVTSYDDANRCFMTILDKNKAPEKLEVFAKPLARPETIVSRGSTCFKTIDNEYLIKFSWGSGAKENEIQFLNRAKQIPDVIQMENSGKLYEIETHRKSFQFPDDKIWVFNAIDQTLSPGKFDITFSDEPYMKRTLTFVKLTPVGRPLHTSVTVHQRGVTNGILIDLDMSSLRENENEKDLPRSITGTTRYMALELLQAIAQKQTSLKQTYRHDLESCFYVLIVGFRIINAFLPQFEGVKELAWNLRRILFGEKGLEFGSPMDPNILYDPIIKAFDGTIEKLEVYVLDKKNNDDIQTGRRGNLLVRKNSRKVAGRKK